MGKLVEGLTKLKKLDLVSKKAEQAENLRKLCWRFRKTSASFWSSSPTACNMRTSTHA